MTTPACIEWRGSVLVLRVRVQPRAARDRIGELLDDRLKVAITAPPVDGQANSHLIAFLAGCFGVPKSRITLAQGETGRNKTLHIDRPGRLPPPLTE
ncbi:MAG: DUF167 family protein [Chromatiales bacterium]|nr:DUF167 family protein [Chromatiales bacterium]